MSIPIREEANMTGEIKIVREANLSSYVETAATKTTNTFTPGTLKSIEQMFLDADQDQDSGYKSAAGFVPPVVRKTYINMDSRNWQQGGVTTVVTPNSAIAPSFELLQPGKEETDARKANRGGGRKPRDQEEETLCPEEEERRRQRRERNKLAAARCRKRRMDQTETLQEEVENWEAKKRVLQDQIQDLQTEREKLQFILEAHRAVCSRGVKPVSSTIPSSSTSATNLVTLGPRVVVKAEPELQHQDTLIQHLTHAEAMEQHQNVVSTTTAKTKAKRPSSLFVAPSSNTITSLNIPIETPTNVMNTLDFNSLMDGRTGLTPTNILTPIMVSMSSTTNLLQTPNVSTPSCGSQQRTSSSRSTVMQELGSPNTGAPNLVSL